MSHFPFFIDTSRLNIIIIGAGNIALRRTKILLSFCNKITILSKEIHPDFKALPQEKLCFIKKSVEEKDLFSFNTVLACTNDSSINTLIYKWTKDEPKLINICDRPELCNFYFPSILHHEQTTIGISSEGDKVSTKNLRQSLAHFLNKGDDYD